MAGRQLSYQGCSDLLFARARATASRSVDHAMRI